MNWQPGKGGALFVPGFDCEGTEFDVATVTPTEDGLWEAGAEVRGAWKRCGTFATVELAKLAAGAAIVTEIAREPV